MPAGLLTPASGIPICDTSPNTPPGEFTWMDLVMLAYQVPIQGHDRTVFIMNQQTLALCLTMSDAGGRPLLLPVPLTEAGRPAGARFALAGFPMIIAPQMPNPEPGTTPVLFGDPSTLHIHLSIARRRR
jgi:HK97 family phage major capsid protein